MKEVPLRIRNLLVLELVLSIVFAVVAVLPVKSANKLSFNGTLRTVCYDCGRKMNTCIACESGYPECNITIDSGTTELGEGDSCIGNNHHTRDNTTLIDSIN